ncbi:hypothetical protein RNJ44_04477 [Nakaseomyces bracarensis]|uniref:Uncharacterized protein n=1 Tax=Nakaseomyces bracarensis TaxID=273131 RepID=A0ABR4NVD3_9SACH
MDLTRYCCLEIARSLCDPQISLYQVRSILQIIPSDELRSVVYKNLICLGSDSFHYYTAFYSATTDKSTLPEYFEQQINVKEMSIGNILQFGEGSTMMLQLDIHDFLNYNDTISLVDVPNVSYISILCPIDPLAIRFWTERLKAHNNRKWINLKILRLPLCGNAMDIYKLISNIPSLGYIECNLEPKHVSEIPLLRQMLHRVENCPEIENKVTASLHIMPRNSITRRPSYTPRNKSMAPIASFYKINSPRPLLPKPTVPRPRKKPKLKRMMTAKSYFGFS